MEYHLLAAGHRRNSSAGRLRALNEEGKPNEIVLGVSL